MATRPGGDHDHHRLEDEAKLRHAEVELGLERGQANQEAAGERDPPRLEAPAALHALLGLGGAQRLNHQHGDPHERHRRPADQHQVGRPPQRHVLAEQPVPYIVEGEADQGERTTGADQHATKGCMPIARDPHRAGARLLARQHHGDEAGREDAEQPDEDEVVRGVGQRALVTAHVDVQGDVPVHAEDGRDERQGGQRRGQHGPAGQPGQAAGEVGGALEQIDASTAVTDPKDQQQRGDHPGAGGRRDDFPDRSAASGLLTLGACCGRCSCECG